MSSAFDRVYTARATTRRSRAMAVLSAEEREDYRRWKRERPEDLADLLIQSLRSANKRNAKIERLCAALKSIVVSCAVHGKDHSAALTALYNIKECAMEALRDNRAL